MQKNKIYLLRFCKYFVPASDRIHEPDGMNENQDEECQRYEKLIAGLGGVDLQLLGLGHNGHIGFNEPAEVFVKQTHCVSLSEKTIQANQRFFESKE